MDYSAIHKAIKDAGLTWATAAEAIGCAPSNLMGVAARRGNSRPVAKRLALLINRDITEIFPDVPAYSEPEPADQRRATVEAARKRLAEAGAAPLNVKSA